MILIGSGEFTPKLAPLDKQLISLASQNLDIPQSDIKVAILPTAAGFEPDYHKWIDAGIEHFSKIKIEAYGVPVAGNKDANNTDFVKSLSAASIIYISGGDPGYLLSSLNGSKVMTEIFRAYSRGVILSAASAGAMVLGQYVLTNPYQISQYLQQPIWKTGLQLTSKSIIPHYDFIAKNDPRLLEKIFESAQDSIKSTLMGIDENTAVFQIDDKITKIFGQGQVTNIL